jgi:hypothetical protein
MRGLTIGLLGMASDHGEAESTIHADGKLF